MPNIYDVLAGTTNPTTPSEPIASAAQDKINIVDAQGKSVGSVPREQLKHYLELGYQVESPEQTKINNYLEDHQGTFEKAGPVSAFLQHAGNEALFGIPEALLSPEQKQYYNAISAQNPAASGAGSVAGFAGSLVAGGPLFKGAAELGRGAEALALGGRAIEDVGLGTKLFTKGLGAVTENATVGAALSAPQVINDLQLGDPKAAAEHIAINAGLGALLGLGGTAALGAASKASGALGGLLDVNENALRSIVHSRDLYSTRLMNDVGKEEMATFLKTNGYLGVSPEVLQKVQAQKELIGQEIGAIRKEADTLGNPGIRVDEFSNKVRQEVIDPLRKIATKSSEVRGMEGYLRELKDSNDFIQASKGLADAEGIVSELHPLSLEEMWTQRKALDQKIFAEQQSKLGNPSPMHEEYTKVRNIMDNDINEALDQAYKKVGKEDVLDRLKELNKSYKLASTTEEVLDRSLERKAANNQFGLGSIIFGAGGAQAGISGILAGHPAAALGLATGPLWKYIKEHGNELIAKYGDKLGLALGDLSNQEIDKRFASLPSVLNNAFSAPGIQAGTHNVDRYLQSIGQTPSKNEDDNFKQLTTTINERASNPQNTQLAELAGAISGSAPNVSQQLNAQNNNALAWLASQTPKDPLGPRPFQPDWNAGKQDKRDFMDKLQIANDPMEVMDHLKKGTLNQNHVMALQSLFPALYQRLKDEIKFIGLNPKTKKKNKLSYNAKLQLSLLLNEPLDASINNVASLQASYAQEQAPQPMANGKLEEIPGAQPTAMQKMQNGLPA